MGRNANPDIAYAGFEIRKALDDAMEQSLPKNIKGVLRQNSANYRSLLALEPAAKKGVTSGDVDPSALQSGVSKIYPNYIYNDPNALPQLTQSLQFLKSDKSSPVNDLQKAGLLGQALQAGLYAGSPLIGPLHRVINPRISSKDFTFARQEALAKALQSFAFGESIQGGNQ
jgi:hypothetical protein